VALALLNVWDLRQYPWGWQIRADFQDDAAGNIHNEAICFPTKPTQAEIDAAVLKRQEALAARPEPIIAEDGAIV